MRAPSWQAARRRDRADVWRRGDALREGARARRKAVRRADAADARGDRRHRGALRRRAGDGPTMTDPMFKGDNSPVHTTFTETRHVFVYNSSSKGHFSLELARVRSDETLRRRGRLASLLAAGRSSTTGRDQVAAARRPWSPRGRDQGRDGRRRTRREVLHRLDAAEGVRRSYLVRTSPTSCRRTFSPHLGEIVTRASRARRGCDWHIQKPRARAAHGVGGVRLRRGSRSWRRSIAGGARHAGDECGGGRRCHIHWLVGWRSVRRPRPSWHPTGSTGGRTPYDRMRTRLNVSGMAGADAAGTRPGAGGTTLRAASSARRLDSDPGEFPWREDRVASRRRRSGCLRGAARLHPCRRRMTSLGCSAWPLARRAAGCSRR